MYMRSFEKRFLVASLLEMTVREGLEELERCER